MNKKPIVIVASARSGSSAYCRHVSNFYNVKRWQEPTRDLEVFESFKKYIKTGNTDYVLKIVSNQIENNKVYRSILDGDCYKIKLTRENKIDQIASHYIGYSTNIWNSENKYARGLTYHVNIDIAVVNTIINTVIADDKLFDILNISFDEEHTYEELIKTTILDDTGMAKLLPPTNYDLLKTVIEEEYGKFR